MAGIKEKIENNPIIFLITSVVGAVAVAAGIQQYFYTQQEKLSASQHQSELRDLDSKLASVKRGMTGHEYFDIRKLLLLPGDTSNIPQSASFFSEDQFYANSKSPDWTFSRSTELALTSELAGEPPDKLPKQLIKASTAFPIYLWKGKEVHKVKDSDLFRNAFAYIILQKIPKDRLKEIIGLGVSMAQEEDDEGKKNQLKSDKPATLAESRAKSAEEFASKLDEIFRGDIVGSFFTLKLTIQLQVAIASPKTTFSLVEIQKVGNVLYSQTLITLHNVKIDDKLSPLYYVRQEVMIISTADTLYVVQTMIPSDDPVPRGKIPSSVTQWMDDFRVRVL
jgi:hypothetical protein